MASWKTTTLGILSLLIVVATVAKTAMTGGIGAVDWASVVPMILAGLTGVVARDHKVSDEQAGAGIK